MRVIIKSTIRKQVTTISGFESGRDRATSSLRKAHGSFNKSLLHDPTPISIFFTQRNFLFAPMFANKRQLALGAHFLPPSVHTLLSVDIHFAHIIFAITRIY